MKNILIYSDIHVCRQDIDECNIVFDEIVEIGNKYSCDTIISLGDNLDSISPGALELNCLAQFIKKLGNKQVILLAAQSHESETKELSSVDIYGILTKNVTIVKEFIDGNHLYCGHFMVNESSKGKYGGTCAKSALVQYKAVYLGHLHSFEHISPNIWQIGSVRWISFDESKDLSKKVVLIQNYGQKDETMTFLDLKSPYPMIELVLNLDPCCTPQRVTLAGSVEGVLTSVSQITHVLDKLPANTKVRITFLGYKSYREWLPIAETYKTKFAKLVEKKDFVLELKEKKEKNTLPLKERFISWAESNQIEVEVKNILLEELK